MKKIYLLTILLLCLAVSGFVDAYPPDNAAVIYFSNMQRFTKPRQDIWDQVFEIAAKPGKTTEPVKNYLKEAEPIIRELEIASRIPQCDWGLDFSQDFEMFVPYVGDMKDFAVVVLADGAVEVERGNYAAAIEKNLTVRRLGHHVSNDTTICFLVSCAITKKSNYALQHILSTYPIDTKTLIHLKQELQQDSYRPLPILPSLLGEKQVSIAAFSKMTLEKFIKDTKDYNDDKNITEQARKIFEKKDPAFNERSVRYIEQCFDSILAASDKPYPQAIADLKKVPEMINNDFEKGNDAAFLATVFTPSFTKSYNYLVRWNTEYNAILAALDVYISAGQTGNLPEELPGTSYIDHFSQKPFIYESTSDGFVLRCQQEDMVDKKVQEYVFKLP